jgi:hypothetical protein
MHAKPRNLFYAHNPLDDMPKRPVEPATPSSFPLRSRPSMLQPRRDLELHFAHPSEKLAFAPGFELQVPQPTTARAAACYWITNRVRTSHRRSLFSMTRPNLGQGHGVLTLACAPSRCDHTHHPSPRTIWQTFEAYHICLAALFPAMLNW